MLWSGSVVNTNWSAMFNWTNMTAGGYGPPGISNDLVFSDAGSAGSSNTITSVVDADTTINSLLFTNITGYQNLAISPAHKLTIVGSVPGYANTPALSAGMEVYAGDNDKVRAALSGLSGTLSITNANTIVQVRQGFAAGTNGSLASLDMSGLGTFDAYMSRILVGVEGGSTKGVAGFVKLARTNILKLAFGYNAGTNLTSGSPSLYLGHNTSAAQVNTNGAGLYLGVSNSISVGYVVVGRGNQSNNLLSFNPAFLAESPSAVFRGTDGSSRISLWTVGDNSPGSQTRSSIGVCDFTGGNIDALIEHLALGRGRVGTTANTGYGTFTFGAGTVDVNTMRVGTMIDEVSSTNSSGVGVMNVNGSGSLIARTSLELGHTNTVARGTVSAIAATMGTLNVNGGTVESTNILIGSTGVINLNSGTLNLQPDWSLEPGRIVNISTLKVGAPGVSDPATLIGAGSISTPNVLTVASNGLISGNTVITAPQLAINGTISPGASAGAITNSGSVTFGPSGRYLFDLQDAAGQPGVDWDYIQAGGALDIQSSAANPFAIAMRSDQDALTNFDAAQSFDWAIASGSSVANFAADKFSVNADSFAADMAGGYFHVTTSGNLLLLSFTNNHAPSAADAQYFSMTGTVLKIPVANLVSRWSDPDGDPVIFTDVNVNSANGNNNVATDGTFIYYTNTTGGTDLISYTIADVRTNPPAIYRPGDTVRTATGNIQVQMPPGMQIARSGGQLIFSGSNGLPGASYYVLASSDLSLPPWQWMRVATNAFDIDGNFIFTNSTGTNAAQFYLLEMP